MVKKLFKFNIFLGPKSDPKGLSRIEYLKLIKCQNKLSQGQSNDTLRSKIGLVLGNLINFFDKIAPRTLKGVPREKL